MSSPKIPYFQLLFILYTQLNELRPAGVHDSLREGVSLEHINSVCTE